MIRDFLAGLFGFALMTAYWPGITGAATTLRWDVAALLAVALFFAPRVRMTAVHCLGLALLAWLFLTVIWSEGQLDGTDAAFKLILAAIAFALGSTMKDLRPLLIGSAIGIGISSAIAIAQWLGWNGIETYDNGLAGLFHNRDRLGAAAALVAIGVAASCPRMWLLLPLLAPSLILTQSRAAWLAVVVGMFVIPIRSRVASVLGMRCSLSILAMAGAIVTIVLHGHDVSIDQRLALASDTIGALNLFGHGLGSFWESFPAHAHLFSVATERPEHPHNEWLWLAYEGGIPAFVLGLAFAVSLWRAAAESPQRATMAGLFVLSFFAMPFHDPATLILGALCAGFLAGRRADHGVEAYDRGSQVRQGVAASLVRQRVL
jgi:hypothetical protein